MQWDAVGLPASGPKHLLNKQQGGTLKLGATNGRSGRGTNKSREVAGLYDSGRTGMFTPGVKHQVPMWWPTATNEAARKGPLVAACTPEECW